MKNIMLFLVLIIAFTLNLNAEWQIDEGFENGSVPNGWTIYDDDEDGSQWRVYENASYANSGSWSVFIDNYLPNDNSDWLITPAVQIAAGDTLSFNARSWYSTENLEVYVSTTNNSINSFNTDIFQTDSITSSYQETTIDLSSYANQTIYIGFYWECENYAILLDDIKVGNSINLIPEIAIPETMEMDVNETVNLDFSNYIVNATPDTWTLGVTGNTNITVNISDYMVELVSSDWAGTEELVFELTDNVESYLDTMNVTVIPPPVNDIALLAMLEPGFPTYLNDTVFLTFTFMNAGNVATTGNINLQCLITDEQSTTVYDQTETYSDVIDSMVTVEYQFATSWTPNAVGSYTITFSTDLVDDNSDNNVISDSIEVYEHFSTGGPDTFGYQWIDNEDPNGPDFNWIDISQTGSSAIMEGVDAFNGDDNFSESISLGFDFPFYGEQFSEFYVDTNGEILLCDNSWQNDYPSNGWGGDGNVFNWMYPIPGYTQMPGLIAVYWDDLEADQSIGDIFYQTFGSEPDRYCVIQWHDFRFHSGQDLQQYLNFEVVLYESGEILMQYLNAATGQTGTNAPHDYGQSSTVAIQNSTAEMGLCYLRELVQGSTWVGVTPEGNMLHNNLAISFYPGADVNGPFISHEEIGNTFSTSPVITASVTDMSEMDSVTLMYNTGSGWESMDYDSREGNEYTFNIENLSTGITFEYYFQATDSMNNSSVLPENAPTEVYSFGILPFADSNVLLMYSANQDYQQIEFDIYQNVLDTLNVNYDIFNWQEHSDYEIPLQYDAVVCYSNSSSHTDYSDSFSIALMNFMDNGDNANPKNVFFSSDNWAYTQSGYSNDEPMKKLFNAYFRTNYVGTTIGGGSNGLAGPEGLGYNDGTIVAVNGSPVGVTGEEVNVYANSPDCIFRNDACPNWYADEVQNPEIGSINSFMFEDGPVNGQAYLYHGVCATWIDNQIYKGYYMSFDLSQITDSDTRIQMMSDALVWFGVIEPQDAESETIAVVSQKLKNYPNPFNPETTILFQVKNPDSKTEVSIYNVRGQLVNRIVDTQMSIGVHSVVWNGLDSNGKRQASGIYYCKFENGKDKQVNKMLLMK